MKKFKMLEKSYAENTEETEKFITIIFNDISTDMITGSIQPTIPLKKDTSSGSTHLKTRSAFTRGKVMKYQKFFQTNQNQVSLAKLKLIDKEAAENGEVDDDNDYRIFLMHMHKETNDMLKQ